MLGKNNEEISEDFGTELVLNLYDCDLEKISDGNHIQKFVTELCDKVIFMKRYGEALIPHFGHDSPITSGYSLVQLIETSSITAHFSEHKKAVYMNIFSCKWFDPDLTEKFCKEWFGAKKVEKWFLERK
jgi:S-adenosylmethionine/arginine decarboxylase-like enzyme